MDEPHQSNPKTMLKKEETVCGEDDPNETGQDKEESAEQGKKSASTCIRTRYLVVLAEYPYAVFFATLTVVIICGLFSFVSQLNAPALPDFSTPIMGFEPRGTLINKRYRTSLLLGSAAGDNLVATFPMQKLGNLTWNASIGLNVSAITVSKTQNRKKLSDIKSNFRLAMCDSPNVFMKRKITYKMVFASKIYGRDIFDAESLKAVCRMEEKVVRKSKGFKSNCFKTNVLMSECCPSWSVGNYIAALSGRFSCQDISPSDVSAVLSLLRRCAPLFHHGLLKENCWNFNHNLEYPICRTIPRQCVKYNAVYNILYYLTDKEFLSPNGDKLEYTAVLSPAARSRQFSEHMYEKYIKRGQISDGNVKLMGTEFYFLKFDTFNIMLMADIIYPAIAMLIILVIMWFYTESVLLTFLLVLSVVSALVISYFLYMVIFGLEFFPFLNITTLIFLVGIGADDAFVFTDVWRQSKQKNPGASLLCITDDTLRHASLSMFVTSLTTAAAFMANFTSQITTIKCFGIYAGIAILCKFSMMVTWFPAVSVINEKLSVPWSCDNKSLRQKVTLLYRQYVNRLVRYLFDKFLPGIVIKFRFFWIAVFTLLTIAGLEVIIFEPGFQLPTSSDFQMFESSHPLEVYELNLKDKFRFETSPSQGSATFDVDVFWGIKAVDNGNKLNPYDYGYLEWDSAFDIIDSESQKWLMDFCARLRKQTFYARKKGITRYCFLEKYYNQSCNDLLIPELSFYPCCKESSFPFNKTILDSCAILAYYRKERLKYLGEDSTIGSFIYDRQGNIKGVHIRVTTNVHISRAYEPVHHFWQRIESWIKREMETAPHGMNRAWWVSNLEFYDLQKSLSTGTLVSMLIAIVLAFAVMLLTTLNVLVSMYAILTIVGIISVTIGSLVLSGWRLNILESITMSVAVGVSIDFAMHYGVAYCLAPNKECRKARVEYSLSRMGSAITMAALTTFIAGAMMMPSRVLSYLQMGHFLMLVMTLGWAFSTFFFQALCCTIGPQGDWGQFSWSNILSFCCNKGSQNAQPREERGLLVAEIEPTESKVVTGVETKV
ncbi:protein dispatched homolog 1-like [Montipora foliosa]|uniref:protein dispatched homolog 1-like n=1 Tax=Montipora foliosa TaxID=591990 RepID=UPI0035F11387